MADPEVVFAARELASAIRTNAAATAAAGGGRGGAPFQGGGADVKMAGGALEQDDSKITAALGGVAEMVVAAAMQIAMQIAKKLAEEAASGAKTVMEKQFFEPWEKTKQWADESGQAGILRTRKEISQYYNRQVELGSIRARNIEMADLEGSYMPTQIVKESYKVGRAIHWALKGAPGLKEMFEAGGFGGE